MDPCKLVLSFPAKLEGYALKIVGQVEFFRVRGFFQKSTIANSRRMVASLRIPNRTPTHLEYYNKSFLNFREIFH